MTDKNNMIKLPVSHKSKSCTSEYGCDNIYNGDTNILIKNIKQDVIYIDAPWGGPEYKQEEKMKLYSECAGV